MYYGTRGFGQVDPGSSVTIDPSTLGPRGGGPVHDPDRPAPNVWSPDAGYRSRVAADAGSGAAAAARAEGAWKVCRAQYQEQYGMSPEEAGAAATEGPCPPEPPEEEDDGTAAYAMYGVLALLLIGGGFLAYRSFQ